MEPSEDNRVENGLAAASSLELRFQDVRYQVKNKSTGEPLHILHGVSGVIRSGRFMAFLGRSGSGKTTLLDLLAGRKTSGRWSGDVRLNGAAVGGMRWKRLCGYVLQHDMLLGSATVHETLMFSAKLRMPSASHQQVLARVDQVLKELGLEHRRDARVGSEASRGLSGGETRRVSIGHELVADVKVLLLDEPTSGLDSTTAYDIVAMLRTLAHNGRIVAATLHQPSSAIGALFDDMMLLANGRLCYAGAFDRLLPHLDGLGHVCPTYVNPTDWAMDLTGDEAALEGLWAGVGDGGLHQPAIGGGDAIMRAAGASAERPSFWLEFRVQWTRNFRQYYRDEFMLMSELAQYVFCGIFIGAMYHPFGDQLEAGTFDRLSAVFFVLTTAAFVPSFTVVTKCGRDLPLEKREIASGMYRISTSHLAKLCTAWPFTIAQGLLFVVCYYFLAGFQITATAFFTTAVIVVLFLLLCETIGLLTASLTRDATVGVLLLSVIMLVCLALGGFLVSEPKPYYTWFETINFFVYAFTAMLLAEFEDLELQSAAGPVNGLKALRATGRLRNNMTLWQNVGVLVGLLVLMRLLAFAGLVRKLGRSSLKRGKAKALASTSASSDDAGPTALV